MMSEVGESIRIQMKNYWQKYSPSVDSMMLSVDAKYMDESDRNEILSYLPDYKGKKVLELGAGIGRLTGRLAKLAQHVTAVDFIQDFIDLNQKENGNQTNITFKCADASQLDYPPESFDLVVSNSLFMYLTDEEVTTLFKKILKWLSPEGYIFLRESCFHAGGTLKREINPSIYRTPIDYCEALQTTKLPNDDAAFKIIKGKSLLTFIQNHCNPNQVCFLAKKVEKLASSELGQFLQKRYSLDKILMAERITGFMWYSTGGAATNRELCTQLALKPNQKVLDVGCGTGGNAFFMARHYKVNVHGIDISPSMIHIAIERQGKMEPSVRKRVQFENNDICTAVCDQETYDVIYSRDVLLFIPNKEALFKKLYALLKPGGTLFFTDHCRGPAPDADHFEEYIMKRRYSLVTKQTQKQILQSAGFKNVQAEDETKEFIRTREGDLRSFVSGQEAFVQDFSEENYIENKDICLRRVQWSKRGQVTWNVFKATK